MRSITTEGLELQTNNSVRRLLLKIETRYNQRRCWRQKYLYATSTSSLQPLTIDLLSCRSTMTKPSHLMASLERPESTYYDILHVAPNASLDVIKASYRLFAIQYHPDKRQHHQQQLNHTSRASLTNTPTKASCPGYSEHFHRLQEAWECLRDATKRKEYDEELKRRCYRSTSRRQSAITIPLSQFEHVVVVVVDDTDQSHIDNDDLKGNNKEDHERQPQDYETRERTNPHNHIDDSDPPHQDQQQQPQQPAQDVLYIYSCRCGHELELWADQVPIDNNGEILLDCNGCSNVFCVVNDIRNNK